MQLATLYNAMAGHLLQNYSLQWAIAILKPTRFFTELTRFFCTTKSVFSLNRLGFRTNSIALQNRLDSLNRTDSVFLENQFDYLIKSFGTVAIQ